MSLPFGGKDNVIHYKGIKDTTKAKSNLILLKTKYLH